MYTYTSSLPSQVTKILDTVEIVAVPIVNPDGYSVSVCPLSVSIFLSLRTSLSTSLLPISFFIFLSI